MPEIRPDNEQLRMQGQIGQLTSPPPMPQANTFVPNAETTDRGRIGAFTNQLGNVLAGQAIERQKLQNQAMISNALISAQSAMNDIYDQQTRREGFNVGAMQATDTHDAMDDIVTVFARGMSEVTSSIDSKFTNDYQREQFYKTFAPIMLQKTNDIQKYYNDQMKQATERSWNANLDLLSNDALGYIYDGNLDAASASFNTMRDMIRDNYYLMGRSGAEAQYAFDQRMNQLLPQVISSLYEQEKYGDITSVYERWGTLLTGQARNTIVSIAGEASSIGQARQTAVASWEAHINDPDFIDPTTGLVSDEKIRELADQISTSEYTYLETVPRAYSGNSLQNGGVGMADALTAGILAGEGNSPENAADWSVESNQQAYGMFQIIPSTWSTFAEKAGLGADAPKTPENQIKVKNTMIQDALDNGVNTPEGFAAYWFGGIKAALEYQNDPTNPKWDNYRDGNGRSMSEYVALFMSGYNEAFSRQGQMSGRQPAPTADLPLQAGIHDADLANTEPGMRSTTPYVGGIIKQILGSVDGVEISGGWRSPEYNASINGVEDSYHVRGNAIDYVIPDSATAEQKQQIVDAIMATGMFGNAFFHDAGSGEHLHVQDYNGGLETWLNNQGYAPVGGSASYKVRTDKVISPALRARVTSELQKLQQAYNSNVQRQYNGIVNNLLQQGWTTRQDLMNAIKGQTINGKPLSPQQQQEVFSRVFPNNPNRIALQDRQEQTALENQQRAQRIQNAEDRLYTGLLDGSIKTYDDLVNKGISKDLPPRQLWMWKEQLDKGNAPDYSALIQIVNSGVDSYMKQGYEGKADFFDAQLVKDAVKNRMQEYYQDHQKLPSTWQIKEWVSYEIDRAPQNTDNWIGSDTRRTNAYVEASRKLGVTYDDQGNAYYQGQKMTWDDTFGIGSDRLTTR